MNATSPSPTAQAMAARAAYCGLPAGAANRFALLQMAKRAGKRFGLGFGELRLLELYVGYSKPGHWTPGGRPAYTRPVFRTAADLGVTPRHVNRLERKLEALGLILRDTRGDGGRGYWRRGAAAGADEGGQGGAYCVDLRPLAARYEALKACAEAAEAENAAIEAARAALSRLMRQARALISEAIAQGAEPVDLPEDLPARPPACRDLSRLQALLARARAFMEGLLASPVDNAAAAHEDGLKMSGAPDISNRDNYITTNLQTVKSKAVETDLPAPPVHNPPAAAQRAGAGAGLDHLTPRDILAALPEEWRYALHRAGGFSWRALAYVAEHRRALLGISEAAWREALAIIGPGAASVALMVLETNRARPDNPVRNVGGALRAMARRAETGDLHLHRSVFGILARKQQGSAARNEA